MLMYIFLLQLHSGLNNPPSASKNVQPTSISEKDQPHTIYCADPHFPIQSPSQTVTHQSGSSSSNMSSNLSSDEYRTADESSSSITTPTFSDLTYTETSSVNIDAFLGPVEAEEESNISTFKLVGDNIDKLIRPRHMRLDNQNQSIHYFHAYGVHDRIDLSNFSDETRVPLLASTDLTNLLPSPSDERALQTKFSVLIGSVLRKNIPFLQIWKVHGQTHHT